MSGSVYERVQRYAQLVDSGRPLTIGEVYEPAMEISDQEEADAYFLILEADLRRHGKTTNQARDIARQNLGYFAGYYDSATRKRVERLFKCAHPVFGSIAACGQPTADAALLAGMRKGAELLHERYDSAKLKRTGE